MPLSGSAFWACILPFEQVNLITNPSFERGTAGWGTITGGTIGTASNKQQFGAWSGSFAPSSNGTAGVTSPTFTAGNGTLYTYSAYINGQSGIPYKLGVGDSAGANVVGTVDFTGGGTWQRYSGTWTEASGATRTLIIKKGGNADTGVVYIDGVDVTPGGLSTHIDGDADGCYWLGLPHNSASVRSGTFRGGGSIVALADLGLKPDDHPGIGMPPQEVTSQSYALLPGAEYQRSRAAERPFSLTFQPISGTTTRDFHITRRTFLNAFKPDLVDPQQPITFWYIGGQGTVQIDAVYAGGGELGQMAGAMAENGALRFIAEDPYWSSPTQEGTALAPRTALGSANFMAKRDPQGRWGTMGANGSTLQGVANALAADAAGVVDALYNNGTLFICGSWGTVAGTVYNDIAMYFPASNTFGTLTGGSIGTQGGAAQGRAVRALYYTPWGSLLVGGDFVKAGGTVSFGNAQWNGNWGTWVGGGITGAGTSVRTFDMLGGTVFLGGRFDTFNGTAAGSVAMWVNNNGGTLVNGANLNAGIVRQLVVGLDGAVYTAGAVQNGAPTNLVGRWNGAWGSLGTGVYGAGAAAVTVASEPNGKIVVGGAFQNTDVGTAYNVAEWSGQQWANLGSGLFINGAITTTWITDLVADPLTGDVYAAGAFNTAGGLKTPDGFARWNGYAWLPLDIDMASSGTGQKIVLAPDRTLFAMGSFQGTAQAAAVAQVVNTGMGEAYPTVKVRTTGSGTARIYQIVNAYPTGDGIYLNYAIQPGEEITLETTPGGRTLTSSAFGNIFGKVIPGSNFASFRLMPGTNYVSLFCDSDNVAASIYWQIRHDSVDGGTVY